MSEIVRLAMIMVTCHSFCLAPLSSVGQEYQTNDNKTLVPVPDPISTLSARTESEHSIAARLPINISDSDLALLSRIKEESEACPKNERVAHTIELLIEHMDEVETSELRRRFSISISDGYTQLGELEKAREFSKKASEIQPPGHFWYSAVLNDIETAMAIGDCDNRGVYEKLLADDELPARRRIVISYRLSKFDIMCGDHQVAINRMKELANSGKKRIGGLESELFIRCDDLVSVLHGHGHLKEAVDFGHWLNTVFPGEYGNANALNNLAVYAEVAGRDDLARDANKELVDRYPDNRLAANALYRLAEFAMQDGNPSLAEDYIRRVVNHPAVDKRLLEVANFSLRQVSQRNQEAANHILQHVPIDQADDANWNMRNWIILGNILAVMCAIAFIARRLRLRRK